MERDLGSVTDDPDRSVQAFEKVSSAFRLTWDDVTFIFSEALNPEASESCSEGQEGLSQGPETPRMRQMKTRKRNRPGRERRPVPLLGLSHTPRRRGSLHVLYCVTEGLKSAKVKPINYAVLSQVYRKEKEPPSVILQRLKDAIDQTHPHKPGQ